MKERYLNYLHKQYCETNGINPISSNIYSNNFIEWISKNKLLLDEYEKYLEYLGVNIEENDIVEISKGKYDTLSKGNISVITEFGKTFGQQSKEFYIFDGVPYSMSKEGILVPKEKIILTHNPYFSESINNWYQLHNKGEKNISIGMFGNITDDNAKEKIKTLEKLSKQMTDDFTFDFDTINDKYFCSLNSKRNIKIKTLIR